MESRYRKSRSENEIWNYQQIELGLNYRMNDVQAALGLSQMDRLDEFIETIKNIIQDYDIVVCMTNKDSQKITKPIIDYLNEK